jgi:hypothetical protein
VIGQPTYRECTAALLLDVNPIALVRRRPGTMTLDEQTRLNSSCQNMATHGETRVNSDPDPADPHDLVWPRVRTVRSC